MQNFAPGDLKEVLALLQTGLELPVEQREAWLAALDASKTRLKPTIAALLQKHAEHETDDFLKDLSRFTAGTAPDGAATIASAPAVGGVVGPYRLLSPVGEGGMSSVWLAERTDGVLRRKIALKLPHWWALSKLTERATQEREILASLEHPNIGRLYDAGITDDGRPYLALEYIEGKAIDVYCRERRLDVRARVALISQIARAVAYAHSRLIVHRDLKPSNILVDAQGQVHLLDFGIAKLIEAGSAANKALTQVGARVLTPEYASPEQITGSPITTESDVYSLGVVAYELLAGKRPYTFKSSLTADWDVLSSDVRAPSAVAEERTSARHLRGDLDTILLKALKKEPNERYASAAAFADDLDRYLRGDPVVARPDSAGYRLRKFAVKHRIAVGAAVAVVLALAAGLAVASWQLRVARVEKRRAEEVKEFVASIFRSADPYFTGEQQMKASQLLTLAKERIDREMASQPESSVELLAIVGEAQANLEEYDAARETLQAALDLSARKLPDGNIHTSKARAQLATIHANEREFDLAKRELDAVIPELRDYGRPAVRALVNALQTRGFMAGDEGDGERAIADMSEAVDIAEESLGANDSETILAKRQLAQEYLMAGRPAEAVEEAREAFGLAQENFGSGGRNALLVETEDVYGRALADSGQLTAGIEHLQNSIKRTEALLGPNNGSVASKLSWLARAQLKLGDLAGATDSMARSVAAATNDLDRARAQASLGVTLVAARRIDTAVDILRGAVNDLQRLDTGEGSWLPNATATYGTALVLAGQNAEAQRVLQESLSSGKAAGPALADTQNALGLSALSSNDAAGALGHFQKALETAGPPEAPTRIRAAAVLGAGMAQLELGKLQEAEQTLQEADAAYRKIYQLPTPALADVQVARGRVAMLEGRADDAAKLFTAADEFWQRYEAKSRWAREASQWRERQAAQKTTRETRPAGSE
ncbi:MAG TPA: protein kinase [Steroidobacteraceae bacterium]|jgi:serine/threonine-protein kinase|nr:protein kinase [Steroidobacteraceae bacterium]